jgi:galactokinase
VTIYDRSGESAPGISQLRDPLRAAFPSLDPGAMRVVRAPGRVNLIGEHTDYNDGFVLPAAIGLETWVAFVRTDDRHVELVLHATGDRAGFALDAIGPAVGGWIDYVAGTAMELARAGASTGGLRGIVAGTLPISAGLSSSAALEVAAALALLEPPDPSTHGLDRIELARLAQAAENHYVGVQCGLMDQFAVVSGREGQALLLDCRSLAWRPVRLPLTTHALVVLHTGSERRLDSSAYNARRAQCERAVAVIARDHPEVGALRDVDGPMLEATARRLDAQTLRRCRHVVDENARVLAAVAAFEAGDLASVGRLFAASHASLRDLFEVSSPALDALVEIASAVDGVAAARMTGAGFGGATINLVRRDAVEALRAAVLERYPPRTGLTPSVFVVEPVDGAGLVRDELGASAQS